MKYELPWAFSIKSDRLRRFLEPQAMLHAIWYVLPPKIKYHLVKRQKKIYNNLIHTFINPWPSSHNLGPCIPEIKLGRGSASARHHQCGISRRQGGVILIGYVERTGREQYLLATGAGQHPLLFMRCCFTLLPVSASSYKNNELVETNLLGTDAVLLPERGRNFRDPQRWMRDSRGEWDCGKQTFQRGAKPSRADTITLHVGLREIRKSFLKLPNDPCVGRSRRVTQKGFVSLLISLLGRSPA